MFGGENRFLLPEEGQTVAGGGLPLAILPSGK